MAREKRGTRWYYYRKRRIGNRLVSEYVGTGEWRVRPPSSTNMNGWKLPWSENGSAKSKRENVRLTKRLTLPATY